MFLWFYLHECHEFLIAIHVEDTAWHGDNDAAQKVQKGTDGHVEKERLVLVKNILGAHRVHFEHDAEASQGHQILEKGRTFLKQVTEQMWVNIIANLCICAITWTPLKRRADENRNENVLLVFQKTAGYRTA